MLKAGTVDDAIERSDISYCVAQPGPFDAGLEIARQMQPASQTACIEVAEEICDDDILTSTPRRRGESPAGLGSDENCHATGPDQATPIISRAARKASRKSMKAALSASCKRRSN